MNLWNMYANYDLTKSHKNGSLISYRKIDILWINVDLIVLMTLMPNQKLSISNNDTMILKTHINRYFQLTLKFWVKIGLPNPSGWITPCCKSVWLIIKHAHEWLLDPYFSILYFFECVSFGFSEDPSVSQLSLFLPNLV